MQGYVIRTVGRLVIILALLAPGAVARAALAPQLVAEI
jgi:hypothetical protein